MLTVCLVVILVTVFGLGRNIDEVDEERLAIFTKVHSSLPPSLPLSLSNSFLLMHFDTLFRSSP